MKMLKKAICVFMAVIMASTLIPITTLASDGDTCLIGTAQELEAFRDRVNKGENNLNAKLTANIVLNENFEQDKFSVSDDGTVTYDNKAVPDSFSTWTPIGDSGYHNYNGTFDGNGYTISGVYINNSDSMEQALFSCIGETGTVKNLGLTNSFIYSKNYVGGIVGTNNYGTVTNCYNDATVYGIYTVGGVVSYGAGVMTDCYNSGTITAVSYNAGGVIAANYGETVKCYNTGKVSGGNQIGGVVGFDNGAVYDCFNLGEVTGDSQVGGVVGYNSFTIANCYNVGVVKGNEQSGSVSGYNPDADITNCYYLEGTATESNAKFISKTAEQFKSGEVAYLLQSAHESTDKIWGQNIGNDDYPVFNGSEVYKNQRYQGCEGNPGEIISYYSNEEKALEYGEHSYTKGGLCKYCNHLKNGKDGFKSASLTLTDGVIINYYVFLSDTALADKGAYIHFTSDNGIDSKINLTNGVKDGERYKFSLSLRPDQMADEITAQVVYSDMSLGNSVVYSVKAYADEVSQQDESRELVDAMLNYGAFSQIYTGNNADNPVTDVTDYTKNAVIGSEYTHKLDNKLEGITIKSATLQLGATITIRVKYVLNDGEDISNFTFKCDNTVLTPVKSGDEYYIYLRNIPPQDFDKMHSFTVSDGVNTSVLEYSAFSYMKNILDNASSYDKKIVNLMNAMYDYNQKAKAYNS